MVAAKRTASEIAEKQARSIKYQITIAKLPLAREIEEFDFAGTPVNESLVRDLAGGDFLAHQRNNPSGLKGGHFSSAVQACPSGWASRRTALGPGYASAS